LDASMMSVESAGITKPVPPAPPAPAASAPYTVRLQPSRLRTTVTPGARDSPEFTTTLLVSTPVPPEAKSEPSCVASPMGVAGAADAVLAPARPIAVASTVAANPAAAARAARASRGRRRECDPDSMVHPSGDGTGGSATLA